MSLFFTPANSLLRPPTNKWDVIKLKSLCMAKDTFIWTEGQPTEWKKLSVIQLIEDYYPEYITI